MKDGGDVILFPKARDEAIRPDVDVAKKRTEDFGSDRQCSHNVQLVLDREAHQLVCPACEQSLDCFDWIQKYIQNWAYQNTRYRQAVQQARDAEKRLIDLQRQEKNAKARVRKKGILLTSAEARGLRDHLRASNRVLDAAYLERGLPVRILIQWGPGGGPRNVLIQRHDGTLTVRPFRGLRRP